MQSSSIPPIPIESQEQDDLFSGWESSDSKSKTPPRSPTPEPMHLFASFGLIAIAYLVLSPLQRTPIGIAPILGVSGLLGFFKHTVYLYHSTKNRKSLQWILWGQSCLLIAAMFSSFFKW